MNVPNTTCLPHGSDAPMFAEPWHAQAFALTVHLNEAGMFTWADWVDRFSATLARHGLLRDLDGGDDYFNAWLETLERVLAEYADIDQAGVAEMRDAWETAYLATPHVAPVHLPSDS